MKNFFLPTSHNAYRPHSLGKKSTLFFLVLLLVVEGLLVSSIVGRPFFADFLSAVIGSEIISLTNAQRAEFALPGLAENAALDAAAQAKAEDMAAKGYFSHIGPDGKEPWAWIAEAGYDYTVAGENLAVRFVDSKDVVEAWMASPTHKANIIKPSYQEIGVGVAQGLYDGAPATFVVQYFGTRRPVVAAQPAAQPVQKPEAAPEISTPAPQVAGESVTASPAPASPAHPIPSPDSPLRTFLRAFAEPRATAAWALGGIALAVVMLLGMAALMHIQIQPGDLLLRGSLLVLFAFFLIAANAQLLSAGGNNQAAAALQHSTVDSNYNGLLIDTSGASTQRFVVER